MAFSIFQTSPNHGEMIFDGTLGELKNRYVQKHRITFSVSEVGESSLEFPALGDALQAQWRGNTLTVVYSPELSSAQVVSAVMERFTVEDLNMEGANIDDVVMEVYHEGQNH